MTTVLAIQERVAVSFGMTIIDMTSDRRSRSIARPRQVAMYLCRHLTRLSLPEIGLLFGRRDHTTIMHGVARVTALMFENEEFRDKVLELREQLTEPTDDL